MSMTNFLSLPRELRDIIYEQFLLIQQPIKPRPQAWFMYHNKPRGLDPTLLRANKAIHHEGRQVLYSRNRFDFSGRSRDELISFLEDVGYNAAYIQYMSISFPAFDYLDLHDVSLEFDSACILEIIRIHCTGVDTLSTRLPVWMDRKLEGLDNPKIVAEAMELVNNCIRALPSLHQVIIEVDKDEWSSLVRKEIERQGWIVRATDYEKQTRIL